MLTTSFWMAAVAALVRLYAEGVWRLVAQVRLVHLLRSIPIAGRRSTQKRAAKRCRSGFELQELAPETQSAICIGLELRHQRPSLVRGDQLIGQQRVEDDPADRLTAD